MKPVITEVEIGRPPAIVWEYLENAEHNPEWLRNMSSCRWITDPPIRVGSRYEQVARFLGKEVRTSFEVSALEKERLVTISSLPGSSFPLTITRKLDPIDAGRCRVTEIAAGDPSGFYRVAEAPMRVMVRLNINRAYGRLKQLLENRERYGRHPRAACPGGGPQTAIRDRIAPEGTKGTDNTSGGTYSRSRVTAR